MREVCGVVVWFASLSVTTIAAHSLFVGLVLSAADPAWIDWGNDASIVMVVPILAWVVAHWWIVRR